MGSPLLQVIQQVQTELGLPQTNYVINAPDNTSRQLGAIASRVGQEMTRARDWTFLIKLFTITVPAPVSTTGNLTAGSTLISAIPSAVIAQILANQMVVSGGTSGSGAQTQGIMQSTRVIAVDSTHYTATMDQPASVAGTAVPLSFRQDTFPAPADYSHSINRTQWDRSMRWELRGPQTPQEAQWVRSGIVATGPRRQFRELGQTTPPFYAYRIWPPPSGTVDSPAQLVAEYISNNWALSAAGVGQITFKADQDTCFYPDELMIMGIKARFFQIKGFAFDSLLEDFQRLQRDLSAQDGGAQSLNLGRQAFPIFISPANVMDGNFPGPPFGTP